MKQRDSFLPFALPDVGRAELVEIEDTVKSGWLTTGPKTHRFESEFADRVGARHAVAVSSCTAAMHLALEASGLARGDEVITSPYTFASTAAVIRYFDARPVFVDILPDSLHLDPAALEGAITPRTKAVLPVHIAGLPADLDAIHEVARRRGLIVIEDAAHGFPSRYRGKMIGGLSDFTCFSFYATKSLTTGEGGMICTAEADSAEHCRRMALHGISKDAWKRYGADGSWYYEVLAPGFKYNMTDLAAAIGLAQLRRADAMWERRREIARRYFEAFSGVDEVSVPPEGGQHQHAWHLYMLRLNLDRLKIDRARFVEELKRRKIGTSVHYIPLHLHPYYRQTYGYEPEDFPIAYREYLREVSLPIYSKMDEQDVDDVTSAVLEVVETHRA